MRLKKKIRRIGNLILWTLLVVGAGILVGSAGYEQNGTVCRNLRIRIHYGQAEPLVTEAEIDSLIWQTAGTITGKALWQIHTERIEKAVKRHPYVSGTSVFESHNGDVIVDLFQRQPVIRIITESNRSLYIGSQGELLPIHPGRPLRMLVASGCIPDSCGLISLEKDDRKPGRSTRSSPIIQDLFRLAQFIDHDPFLKAQVDQIYVDPNGEYELIPKVGDHVVLLGDARDLEDKFRRLRLFYRKGLTQTGWNKYQFINIRYKNQVVCSNR